MFCGSIRARCYPFYMPKKRFHGVNPKGGVQLHTSTYQDIPGHFTFTDLVVYTTEIVPGEKAAHKRLKPTAANLESSPSVAGGGGVCSGGGGLSVFLVLSRATT